MPLVRYLPLSLTLLRALLGPALLLLATWYPDKALFGACLVAAFLSDVFDGIIARRLRIATATLRRLDSIADSLFYVCAGIAAWRLYPNAVSERSTALIVLAALELVRYAYDYAKFRREAAYHMWSSKAWSIFLFAGFLGLFCFGHQGIWLSLAVYAGIVADLEGLAISVVLSELKGDVPSLLHACRLRAAGGA
ncbi:MAG TPA: CDP-alcohol phosphatidyltransferase family protein [Burkholderiales bacterium]